MHRMITKIQAFAKIYKEWMQAWLNIEMNISVNLIKRAIKIDLTPCKF